MKCTSRIEGSWWDFEFESLSLEVLDVLPGVEPDAKGKDVVDPFFRITFVVVFTRDGFVSREAI